VARTHLEYETMKYDRSHHQTSNQPSREYLLLEGPRFGSAAAQFKVTAPPSTASGVVVVGN
jgi:hypothetical protein